VDRWSSAILLLELQVMGRSTTHPKILMAAVRQRAARIAKDRRILSLFLLLDWFCAIKVGEANKETLKKPLGIDLSKPSEGNTFNNVVKTGSVMSSLEITVSKHFFRHVAILPMLPLLQKTRMER
jgi:hypothetical protein